MQTWPTTRVMLLRGLATLGIFLAFASFSFAQETQLSQAKEALPIPISNFRTLRDADIYAKALVTALKAEKDITGKFRELTIVHLGNYVPKQLKWILSHLDKAKVPVKFSLVTRSELEEVVQSVKEKAATNPAAFLEYAKLPMTNVEKESEKLRPVMVRMMDDTLLHIKYIFGMPNGLTWWSTERSEGLKKTEAKIAASFVAATAVTTAFSIYLKQAQGLDPHILRGLAFVVGWTWLNSYEWRRFDELVSQSRYLKEYAKHGQNFKGVFNGVETELAMANGRITKYAGKALIGMLSGAFVYAAIFSVDSVFSWHFAEKVFINSMISSLARVSVEDWLYGSKMPKLNDDGSVTVQVEKGNWNLNKWIVVNSGWLMVFWISKNMSLLGVGPLADTFYYSLGALGIAKNFWDERFNIRNYFQKLAWYFRDKQIKYCEGVILGTEMPMTLLVH